MKIQRDVFLAPLDWLCAGHREHPAIMEAFAGGLRLDGVLEGGGGAV